MADGRKEKLAGGWAPHKITVTVTVTVGTRTRVERFLDTLRWLFDAPGKAVLSLTTLIGLLAGLVIAWKRLRGAAS